MPGFFIAIIVVLVIAGWAFATHNRFAQTSNLVIESWRQVDVELQRRHDLIPNLVAVVSGYAQHERSLFEQITSARAHALAAQTPGQLTVPESTLSDGVGRVLAIAEAYPDLKASTNFLQLQYALVACEDRIAAGRRFYNGNVRALNTLIDSFPSSLLAGGHTRAEYFMPEPGASQPVQVNMGSSNGLV